MESNGTGKPRRTYGWETVHVFVSSTFNDMHGERDYLVKEVFPELRDWCEERKLRLVDIDLRWGVNEADATHNQRVVEVCLQNIDRCRPFFLCFLGQRYGWIPGLGDVSAESAPGKAWVRRTPCENLTETLHRNPAGQSRPAKAGDQPEPSVAWCGGNPGCEAYTGSM